MPEHLLCLFEGLNHPNLHFTAFFPIFLICFSVFHFSFQNSFVILLFCTFLFLSSHITFTPLFPWLSAISSYFSSCKIPAPSAFLYDYLSVPFSHSTYLLFFLSPSLSNTLSLSLSIIHGTVTLGIIGPCNITTATTQQKQPHWIMGNWVASQEREGAGGAAKGGLYHMHTHSHTCTCTHTVHRHLFRCPTKLE